MYKIFDKVNNSGQVPNNMRIIPID